MLDHSTEGSLQGIENTEKARENPLKGRDLERATVENVHLS